MNRSDYIAGIYAITATKAISHVHLCSPREQGLNRRIVLLLTGCPISFSSTLEHGMRSKYLYLSTSITVSLDRPSW